MTIPNILAEARGFDLISGISRHDLPTLSAYRALVDRIRGNVDRLLPETNQYTTDQVPVARRQLRASWRPVPPLLAKVDQALATLAGQVQEVVLDQTRTAAYQVQARQTAIDSGIATLRDLGSQISDRCEAVLAKAQRLALPARPEPRDALQEARIAGLKADCQLLVSRVDGRNDTAPSEFVDRMQARLVTALADNDQLAAWLLCSPWVADILAPSLAFDGYVLTEVRARWNAAIASALGGGSGETVDAISVQQALADPTNGLPTLIVAVSGFLASVASDLADYATAQARRLAPISVITG